MITVQLDFEKAYDPVNWSFLTCMMYNMGFGPHMCQLIFLLWQNATSCVMLNGRVTSNLFLTRSMRQGCRLGPLLFSIVTHPLLVILLNLATSGDIAGLHLHFGGQKVAQVLSNLVTSGDILYLMVELLQKFFLLDPCGMDVH